MISCIAILVASLIGNFYFYSQLFASGQVSFRRERIANLQNQLLDLQRQASNLQNERDQLKAQIKPLEIQVENLQNKTTALLRENFLLQNMKDNLEGQLYQLLLANQGKTATLVTRLGASDMRYNYSGQEIRLYISGEVWNVGSVTAQNCRLHVTLYQGDVVANDTYIDLGTIEAGSYVDVARNIYYSGTALTKWRIIPESD